MSTIGTMLKTLRWQHWCYLILLIVILTMSFRGYQHLRDPLRFPITLVQVKGDYTHEEPKQLKTVITPFAEMGFFNLSSNDLQQTLTTTFPWVAKVNIRRRWPAILELDFVEKRAVAVWNQQALLADDVTVFMPPKSQFPVNLPQITGPDDQQIPLYAALQRMDQLFSALNLSVTAINLSSRHSWTIVLNNGITVIIGKVDIWTRIRRFIDVYPEIIGENAKKVASIDLRYPNGIAVTWKK